MAKRTPSVKEKPELRAQWDDYNNQVRARIAAAAERSRANPRPYPDVPSLAAHVEAFTAELRAELGKAMDAIRALETAVGELKAVPVVDLPEPARE